jgi:hypothetical protein
MGVAVPLPVWVGRINYAERFHVEPHKVNPPFLWWRRIIAIDGARRKRAARETVESLGLGKVDEETRQLYEDLVLTMKGIKNV